MCHFKVKCLKQKFPDCQQCHFCSTVTARSHTNKPANGRTDPTVSTGCLELQACAWKARCPGLCLWHSIVPLKPNSSLTQLHRCWGSGGSTGLCFFNQQKSSHGRALTHVRPWLQIPAQWDILHLFPLGNLRRMGRRQTATRDREVLATRARFLTADICVTVIHSGGMWKWAPAESPNSTTPCESAPN